MREKQCTKCLETKPLDQFYRLASSSDGRRPDCKACEGKPARIITPEERFWSKVEKGEGCWEWTAGVATNNGYGRFWVDVERQHEVAHRYAWEITNGPIPDGLSVCHHCDNPACVRPDHLFVGTHAENLQDAVLKGKIATLTPSDVRKIRKLRNKTNLTQAEVAERFGVGRGAVEHIERGTTWGWLE